MIHIALWASCFILNVCPLAHFLSYFCPILNSWDCETLDRRKYRFNSQFWEIFLKIFSKYFFLTHSSESPVLELWPELIRRCCLYGATSARVTLNSWNWNIDNRYWNPFLNRDGRPLTPRPGFHCKVWFKSEPVPELQGRACWWRPLARRRPCRQERSGSAEGENHPKYFSLSIFCNSYGDLHLICL